MNPAGQVRSVSAPATSAAGAEVVEVVADVEVVVVDVVVVVEDSSGGSEELVGGSVVDPNIDVDEVDDVVVAWHCIPQLRITSSPTAFWRIRSASLVLTTQFPSASHTGGRHLSSRTDARSVNRASLASGPAPVLTGCPQSPSAARAAAPGAS